MPPRKVYSVPIYSALKTRAPWRVTMSDDPDPELSAQLIVRTEQEGNTTHYRWEDVIQDVFEVRRRVFSIRTPKDIMELIEDWGPGQPEGTLTRVPREFRWQRCWTPASFATD